MKKFLLMTLCVLAAMSASAVDTFYINNFTINPGETKLVEINLDNDSVYTALQADIYLPEGLTIEQEDGDFLFGLTNRKGRDHTISSTMLSSGAIRILIASQTLKTFSGNNGALVTFNIIADNSFSGSKTIQMKNIIATDNARVKHYMPNQATTVTQEGYVPPTPTGDADCFYINDFSIEPGETKLVEINLDNDSVYTALQADIYLPEGLTIEQEDGDYLFDLTSRKGRDHVISSTMLSSGAIRILIASQSLKTFKNNSGALVTFNIIADNSFCGPKTIQMRNIIATDDARVKHYFPNTTCTVTGGEPAVPVTSIETASYDIPKGMRAKFNVRVNPSNATNKTLAWNSSDSSIATMTADGTIETLEIGTVTITATTTDGSNLSLSYVINVTEAQQSGNSLDVNGDGYITSTDITMIYNYLLGN